MMRCAVRTLAALLIVAGGAAGAEGEAQVEFVKKLAAGKQQQMVVYGTSLTSGGAWVQQLRQLFFDKHPGMLTISNGAQSGQNSNWGLRNVQERVIARKPDVVLIEFGVNDAVQTFNISTEQCRANVRSMVEAIQKALPECEIILMTMNCVAGANGAKRGGTLPEYYQVYRDVAAEKKLRLIDHYVQWKSLQEREPRKFDAFVPDGVHPNAAGCKQVMVPEFERVFFPKK